MDLREILSGGMDGTHLAQYRNQYMVFVITLINIRVHETLGNSWVLERLGAPKGGLSAMESLISVWYIFLLFRLIFFSNPWGGGQILVFLPLFANAYVIHPTIRHTVCSVQTSHILINHCEQIVINYGL
jgi:hypothetical protein